MKRVLALAVVALCFMAAPALAVDDTPGENLGGYDVQANAMAFSFQPVFPAFLPTGDAPFEGTIGLSTGRVKSGGNSFGRAAIVWPGNAAADPGPLIGVGFGQEEVGALFPKWPLQAQATQGDGEVITGAPPGVSMKAIGYPDRGAGDVRSADVNVPGVILAEHVASTSDTVVMDASASSVARVTFDGVSLLGGHITIEQIRSISETTSTGNSSTQSGDVDIVGMKIGGIDVSVTDDGFKVTGVPPDAESAPGAGDEPFPGQSPEEQVQQVLANLGARITLFNGVGRTAGGQAHHYELGLVLSVDNPAGGQRPIPPGRFDIILASTTSSSLGSPLFAFGGAGGFGGSGGSGGSESGTGALGGGSQAPESVSIGEGPTVGPSSLDGVDQALGGTGGSGSGTLGGVLDGAPQRVDYRFNGLPRGMVIVWLLAALLAARWIRNFFNSIMGAKASEGSEA
jgi:hypothetical protein